MTTEEQVIFNKSIHLRKTVKKTFIQDTVTDSSAALIMENCRLHVRGYVHSYFKLSLSVPNMTNVLH